MTKCIKTRKKPYRENGEAFLFRGKYGNKEIGMKTCNQQKRGFWGFPVPLITLYSILLNSVLKSCEQLKTNG